MNSRAIEAGRGGFLVVDDLVGERAPTMRARRRTPAGTVPGMVEVAEGTDPNALLPDSGPLRGAAARALRIRMVELLALEVDPAARAAAARQIAALGSPLPAGVLRALAALALDADVGVRRSAASTLVRLIEALSPMQRSELVGRLATSPRHELRLLVALALRHGALVVGGLSALEHLVDDPEPEVQRAALVSARMRMADAPARLMAIMRRKLAR